MGFASQKGGGQFNVFFYDKKKKGRMAEFNSFLSAKCTFSDARTTAGFNSAMNAKSQRRIGF